MKIPKAGNVGMDIWNTNLKQVKMFFLILGNVKMYDNSYTANILREDGLIITNCTFVPSDKAYCLLESCQSR